MTTPSALDALRCCFSEMKRNSFDMDNWSCDDGHSSFYAALSPDERSASTCFIQVFFACILCICKSEYPLHWYGRTTSAFGLN
ncbi:hypothetical protein Y032_0003g1261 [Ancylostoma ceylanicum]|uniref:Uncharacterized protein n=1 Tax=Ancylostoma ceylanicum TaxID=53326 RepID=A0A016VW43_9BILA|nr:hypothetical protein Y032_0003g1261 [Ancylostoma ceylanicum]